MTGIQLNFINNSNDINNSEIVIFQKNVALPNSFPVAWKVISNLQKGSNHPFVVPMSLSVSASDSFGNFTPQLPATNGNRFDLVSSIVGNELKLSSQNASSPFVIEVYNEIPVGSINAQIYRDGRLLAIKTGIAPGQNAGFQFNPTIYLSLVQNIAEGEMMDRLTMENSNAEISLLGIASADIVLTGGGSGTGAQPLIFNLQNIKYA